MHTYETLFITSPVLPEEDEKAAVDALAGIIAEGGGTMVANERWGRRRLAYPIEKHEDGVYIRFLYDSEVEVPKELERRIKLSDKILRALTVKLTLEWAEDAKKQAVIDAERRVEAEARAKEEAAAAEKAAAEAAEKAAKEEAEKAAAAAAAPAAESEATPEAAPEAAPDAAAEAPAKAEVTPDDEAKS